MTVKLIRKQNFTIRIVRVKFESHPFEWRLKVGRLWIKDPTSHSSVEGALSAAKEVVEYFATHVVPVERRIISRRL